MKMIHFEVKKKDEKGCIYVQVVEGNRKSNGNLDEYIVGVSQCRGKDIKSECFLGF